MDRLARVIDRYQFRDRLGELRRKQAGYFTFLLKLDIAAFHTINICYGYEAGDALLAEISVRLDAFVGAVVGRLGSNEFAIAAIVPDRPAGTTLASAISAQLSVPFELPSASLRVHFAVGYVVDDDSTDDMVLIRRAGAALSQSKASRALNVTSFDYASALEIRHRMRLTAELQAAVVRQEFVLHFQPKVELATKAIVGAEALIRWRHPVRGLELPSSFISIAEKSGMIVDIGAWAIRGVLETAKRVNCARSTPLGFSLNVSGVELTRSDIVERMNVALALAEVDPSWITLELTETSLMDSSPATLDKLRKLRALGLGLAIDDFGTGYSSLRYIEMFPISEIKIDRSFVRDMLNSSVKRVIIEAVIKLGKELGAQVTAEGVETETECRMLVDADCRFGQGFLFYMAMTEAELTESSEVPSRLAG